MSAVPRGAKPVVRVALLAAWFALAGLFALTHVMWRDEVRALSYAVQGADTAAMLRLLRGDGHPALWYVLLRAGYALTGSMAVLPVLAFVIGAAAAALIALRAPFGWPLIALALFGRFGAYEYVAMARNYGLSALFLFAIAMLYPRWRAQGIGIGVLLALLCNTNVHSVVLAVAFLLFWTIDLCGDATIARNRVARLISINALIVALGAIACVAEVYPPRNDIAQLAPPPGGMLVYAATLPAHLGEVYRLLAPAWLGAAGAPLLLVLLSVSLLALVRAPGALTAAVVALAGLLVLFGLVYPGSYRHQALYPLFLVTMLWVARQGRYAHAGTSWPVERIGIGALAILLALQLDGTIAQLRDRVTGVPESRARDLGTLLHRRDLARAIVIGDPDFVLEPLGYYAPNPVYLVRERRFGRIATFTRAAERPIGVADVLAAARMLHARTARPIAIVLRDRPDVSETPGLHPRGSYGPRRVARGEAAAFLAATHRIALFGPASSGETYAVYRYPAS